ASGSATFMRARWPWPQRAIPHASSDGCLVAGGPTTIVDRLQHADDTVVAKALQILDCPSLGLRRSALHHALDQFLRQLGGLVVGPGQVESGSELLQHVAHAPLAAGQMENQVRPHECPANPRSVADGVIDLARSGDAVVHEVQDLPPERFLQTVGYVT